MHSLNLEFSEFNHVECTSVSQLHKAVHDTISVQCSRPKTVAEKLAFFGAFLEYIC